MPEGHLLHRLARDHAELAGRRVRATSPQGRFAEGAAALDGRLLMTVEAYGKHLHHRFEGDPGLHSHLGMQGKWIRLAADRPPRPQVRLRLATNSTAWDLIAPGTCELVVDAAWAELVGSLGPDPLAPAPGDDERAWKAVSAYPGTVGAALLDQSVIAGVGNVLRAETLFRAGLHPSHPAADLDRATFDRLWRDLVVLMARSVDDGQILPEARTVYKQLACAACGTAVESWTLAGRTAYACPRCQPQPR